MVSTVKSEPATDASASATSSSASLARLSDVEYLVARSTTARAAGKLTEAKAWLVTARLAFPGDNAVQLEAYRAECGDRDAVAAARTMAQMVAAGGKRDRRAEAEIRRMVSALSADEMESPGESSSSSSAEEGADAAFLSSVYDRMPKDVRQRMLLDSAAEAAAAGDVELHARRTMLAFDRFPELVASMGADLLSCVIRAARARAESKSAAAVRSAGGDGKVDPLSRLLVMEVFPRLLSVTQLKLDSEVLLDVLHLTVAYGLDYANASSFSGSSPSSPSSSLPAAPWKTARTYVEEVGLRLGWSLTEDLSEMSTDSLWKRVHSFAQREQQQQQQQHHPGGGGRAKSSSMEWVAELFHVSMLGLAQALAEYVSRSREDGSREEGEEAALVEAFVSHTDDGAPVHGGAGGASSASSAAAPVLPSKRRRTTAGAEENESRFPHLTHGAAPEGASPLASSFLTAVQFLDLIQSDPRLETRMQQGLRPHLLGFGRFIADVALFQGKFREALHALRDLPASAGDAEDCRHHLKVSTVQFCLGDHAAAADHAIKATRCSKSLSGWNDEEVVTGRPAGHGVVLRLRDGHHGGGGGSGSRRHVHFLPFTSRQILSYCCRMLIYVLKDRCLRPPAAAGGGGGRGGGGPGSRLDDMAVGHVIVLLQYVYPEERDLFHLLVSRIKMRESFFYSTLTSYLFHVEFLEEFSALLDDPARKVNLDICPPPPASSSSSSSSASVSLRKVGTRGSNRGEKEEVRAALRAQAARSHHRLDYVVVDFLEKNASTILDCLVHQY